MMSSHVVMISTSCEMWFNAQEEMLAVSGTQRHVGGPLQACQPKLLKNLETPCNSMMATA